jgi:hypothetical protein
MRSATEWGRVTIRLEENLIAVSRRIGREIARMVISRLLRRIAAYGRSRRCYSLKFPTNFFSRNDLKRRAVSDV